MEVELVHLRKELDAKKFQSKYENSVNFPLILKLGLNILLKISTDNHT